MLNTKLKAPYIIISAATSIKVGLKIAVLLNGDLRTMEYCFPRLKKALPKNHIYSYTLTTTDIRGSSTHKAKKKSFSEDIGRTDGVELLDANKLQILFPEITHIEVLEKKSMDEKHKAISKIAAASINPSFFTRKYRKENALYDIFVTLNQLLLNKKSYLALLAAEKANEEEFDIILRTRPDIYPKHNISWPNKDQILVDCLSGSRRRQLNAFDGFFAGSHAAVGSLLNGYDEYLKLLESGELMQSYCKEISFERLGFKTSFSRQIHIEDRNSFLRNESFFRKKISDLNAYEAVDRKLGIKLVR